MRPSVLPVFHQAGKRHVFDQVKKVADLTRPHWKGGWYRDGGYHSYDGCIPIVATTLEWLREHGLARPVFWRFGRDGRQLLGSVRGAFSWTKPPPCAPEPARLATCPCAGRAAPTTSPARRPPPKPSVSWLPLQPEPEEDRDQEPGKRRGLFRRRT
ncbi:hypothetical protein [Streptomyces scopuliridis]|uniref:hypothetical protein n=1 Tax=Streptomyces scopuliridis TaxID=452529 RepID=UPI00369319EB